VSRRPGHRWRGGLPRRAWRLAKHLLPLVVLGAWVAEMSAAGRMPGGDGPHLLGTSMRLGLMLRALELGPLVEALGTLVGPHPPGAYVAPAAAYAVLGTAWSHTHLVAMALVLWISWDGIRRLGGGVPGAMAFAACGLVWTQADNAGVDLMAGACVVQSLSWLVRSDRLRDRRAASLWGLWMAVAFLVKYTAPLFLFLPCVWAAGWVVRHGRWRSLLGAVATFAVVGGLWYATHLHQVAGYIGASGDSSNALLTNTSLLTGPWWGTERLLWYPSVLVDAWGWPGAWALSVGVGLGLLRRRGLAGQWAVPMLGVVGGLVVLNAQIQRQDRYVAPAVPLLAAVGGAGPGGWLALPVMAMGAYGAASIYRSWTDVPTTRQYEHGWPPDGGDWPWVQTAFQPISLDLDAWQIARGVEALRLAHPEPAGTVGLLLDDAASAPPFGAYLSAVTRAGLRWDLATVVLMQRGATPGAPPPAAVFVGPFTTDAWPPRTFRVLLAVVSPSDRRRLDWVDRKGFVLVDSWPLPGSHVGRLYALPDGLPAAGPDELPEMVEPR
jgi:hypothetical protein